MKQHAIFCTAAQKNQQHYLDRVAKWHAMIHPLFGADADLFCFVDGALDSRPELEGLQYIELTPALGRTSTARFEGRKRSFGEALRRLAEYRWLMHVESDVLICRAAHIREFWEKDGLFGSMDEKYNFLESGLLILNDSYARDKLAAHYTSKEGIEEDELFESYLRKYAFRTVFRSRRAEGEYIDQHSFDYIAQTDGMPDKPPELSESNNRIFITDYHCPGDTLEDTAAIRDLHMARPDLRINVSTTAQELWDNNPHLDRSVTMANANIVFHIEQPLISRCNELDIHVIDCIRLFLEDRLGVKIPPGPRRVDVHLTDDERSITKLHELVPELNLTRPYWLIVPDGKSDYTTKIWAHDRYQEVVNRTKHVIQWVQVGAAEHHHKPLDGVLDLLGKTTHRQLLSLMYHASGVLCGITYLMHMASMPRPDNRLRPCVVLNGGRESSSFTHYPGHIHLETVGTLPCCRHGGCWKGKVDKDCSMPVTLPTGQIIPRCMDKITVDDVVSAISKYHDL